MRIGELATLTDTPARSLRYYEAQGLIIPERLANGYRDYGPHLVDRVVQIRGLIDAGIPTRIIRLMLPCLGQPQQIVVEDAEPELLDLLGTERDKMTHRIACLTRNRDAIASYLDALSQALAQKATTAA